MENQFFVDSSYLSPEALEKKHRLETDPSSRKNHMEDPVRCARPGDGADAVLRLQQIYGQGCAGGAGA